jgi:hypothetical protein
VFGHAAFKHKRCRAKNVLVFGAAQSAGHAKANMGPDNPSQHRNGAPVIDHELRPDDAILILRLHKSLEARDFTSLATFVDDYLDHGGQLRGVLISGKSFPGWENLDGLIAHLKFVRHHHTLIDRIAVVADGLVARLLPSVASRFVNATLKHFDDEATALAWLVPTPVNGDRSADEASAS